MKYAFPADYDQRSCYLVPINAALIPIVAGMLRHFEHRGAWLSQDDYERGYNAIAELQACMMRLCVDQLIESNDRLYRMLATAIYGDSFDVVSTDPLDVQPAIAPTHNLAIAHDDSILGRIDSTQQLLINALNGTETPKFDRPIGIRDSLESILAQLQSGESLDPEILAQLQLIAGLVA
jgi:hypothetical protein